MNASAERTSDLLDGLNDAQRAAAAYGRRAGAHFEAGPLLVIAGAGTGKTMTLAHRVAHLVAEGVDPRRILLLTFSRRAAEEMTRRAMRILATAGQGDRKLAWAGTFHSIANRLLRIYAPNVGLPDTFSVMDRGDSADLMDVARNTLTLDRTRKRFPRKDTCLEIYSRTVNARDGLETVLHQVFPWCADWHEELRTLFRRYVELKQEQFVLDYDDLLLYWYHLMQSPELAADVGGRFDHVLVDEYQDTNRLQAEILMALKPDGRGVTVVGDDAQAIYGFRAATVENILEFPSRFAPAAEVIKLEHNYRSRQPVLDVANALMAESPRQYEKALYTRREGGTAPVLVAVADNESQSDYVIDQLLAHREEGVALRDQAVLFRSSHHSDHLELELTRRNIPYVKYGGLKFLEAAHVKDVLAVLKWADNPRNRPAAFRSVQLAPGAGPAAAERAYLRLAAEDWRFGALAKSRPPRTSAAEWTALVQLLEGLAAGDPGAGWQADLERVRTWYEPVLETRYDAAHMRRGDLEQLAAIAARYPTRERFLTELTLDPPVATGDESGDPLLDEDYLILSTVHSAKGQEWRSVYLLNVVDGNFPNEFASSPEEVEEERRLLYVATTRARDFLYLMQPLRFFVPGQGGDRHVYGGRSRFLTRNVLATLGRAAHASVAGGREATRVEARVDVAAKLRAEW